MTKLVAMPCRVSGRRAPTMRTDDAVDVARIHLDLDLGGEEATIRLGGEALQRRMSKLVHDLKLDHLMHHSIA